MQTPTSSPTRHRPATPAEKYPQSTAGEPSSGSASRNQNGSGPRSPGAETQTWGLFEILYRAAKDHTIQIIASREADGKEDRMLRLTFLCSPTPDQASDGESPPEDRPDASTAQTAPIPNMTVTGPPEEFDAPDGVAHFFRASLQRSHSLAEAREKADRAHQLAIEAEKRRQNAATARKANADPGGPLFSSAEKKSSESGATARGDTADSDENADADETGSAAE